MEWVKALHVISVLAWMAGMMYLPRLFVYHAESPAGSEKSETFKVMEAKLLRIIMNPAFVATWVFGLTLGWMRFSGDPSQLLKPWALTKIAGILFLTGWHHYLAKARKALAAGTNTKSEKFWRMTNELPFLAAIAMVLAVTLEFGR